MLSQITFSITCCVHIFSVLRTKFPYQMLLRMCTLGDVSSVHVILLIRERWLYHIFEILQFQMRNIEYFNTSSTVTCALYVNTGSTKCLRWKSTFWIWDTEKPELVFVRVNHYVHPQMLQKTIINHESKTNCKCKWDVVYQIDSPIKFMAINLNLLTKTNTVSPLILVCGLMDNYFWQIG